MENLVEFNYSGVVVTQIFQEEIENKKGDRYNVYLIRFNETTKYLSYVVPENEEQALIGAKMYFNLNSSERMITESKIIGYIEKKYNMKPNLNEIPEKFHILFTSDWNQGNDSNLSPLQRAELNNLQLEYNRWSINEAIRKSKPVKEEEFIGGFE
jgi:hypothetical protein